MPAIHGSPTRATVTSYGPHLREVSVRADAERDHRAYWREVARCGSAIGMPPFRFEMPPPGPGFHSRLRWGEGAGIHFLDGETNRPVSQHAKEDIRGDAVVIGGLRRGQLRIAHGPDARTLIEPATLFVADYGRRMHLDWTAHNFLFLVLPRKMVAAALGRYADFRGETLHTMPNRGLAPLLWSQLTQMAAHCHTLAAEEWPAALSASAELSLGVLRHYFGVNGKGPEPSQGNLLSAARRYMERCCDRTDLAAEEIAAAVGCSRTQLYRVFAQAGLVVGDCLRELRLNRARVALEAGTNAGSLGALAFQCGYSDLSAFGKAFRRRFGMPPSAWRAHH